MGDPIHIPPIPDDAQRAQPHAAPVDLSKPAAAPTSSGPVELPDSNGVMMQQQQQIPMVDPAEIERLRAMAAQQQRQPQVQEYKSPEPIEAMFAQLRDDQKKLERALMISSLGLFGAAIILVYLTQKKGLPTPDLDINL